MFYNPLKSKCIRIIIVLDILLEKGIRRGSVKYFVGIDLGTSALKLLLVDGYGEIVKTVLRTYSAQYPKSGWSEQNPEDMGASKLPSSGRQEYLQGIINEIMFK